MRCPVFVDGGGGGFAIQAPGQRTYRAHIDYQIDQCPFTCRRCGVAKPVAEMCPHHRYLCLKCYSVKGNEWQRANVERSDRSKRKSHLLIKFGLTLEEFQQWLESQGGVCAICKRVIDDVRGFSPHVDHDHLTGKLRGILCFKCNVGLGAFSDNIESLESAIAYLKQGGMWVEDLIINGTLGNLNVDRCQANRIA